MYSKARVRSTAKFAGWPDVNSSLNSYPRAKGKGVRTIPRYLPGRLCAVPIKALPDMLMARSLPNLSSAYSACQACRGVAPWTG